MSRNLFELLVDDAEDASIPAAVAAPAKQPLQPQKQQQSQPDRRQAQQTQAQKPRDQKPKDQAANSNQARGNSARQGQRQGPRNADTTPFELAPNHKEENASKVSSGDRRHGTRGGHRPNHGREFDRRSANGPFKNSEKKEVAGKGSWGDAIKSEIDEEGNPIPPADVAADADVDPAEAAALTAEAEVAAKEKELEDSYKTLEQFMAEKEAKRAAQAKEVTARRANEGVDENQWKGSLVLQKQEEELFADLKKKPSERKIKEKATKQQLEIESGFAPPPRERTERTGGNRDNNRDGNRDGNRGGARGGRGAPRGAANGAPRGGRGGFGRGGNSSQPNFNVNDQSAFPSLGSQ